MKLRELSRGSPRKKKKKNTVVQVIDLLTKSTVFFLCSRCILNSLISLFFLGDGPGGGGSNFVQPFCSPLIVLALLRAWDSKLCYIQLCRSYLLQ